MTTVEIELSLTQVLALQRRLERADLEIPAEGDIPDAEEWADETGSSIEDYPHEWGAEQALVEIMDAGPDEVAYVGPQPVPADEHPENRAERARQRKRNQRNNLRGSML
jgi:hypothetical protein